MILLILMPIAMTMTLIWKRQQQSVRPIGVGGPAIESGVQPVELAHREAGKFAGYREVELPARVHRGNHLGIGQRINIP